MAHLSPKPKVLLFDVFGTCVDWRTTVTNGLAEACKRAASLPINKLSNRVRDKATSMTAEDWGKFAQEWRNTYTRFVHSVAMDPSIAWKSVDQHHLDALEELLVVWELHDLWTGQELIDMSLIWHKLEPWNDSSSGIKYLNTQFQTCTLSNGNLALLRDLKAHAGLDFTDVFSAEMFSSYKPSPKVYLGAVEKLGLRADECVMVAAHLSDLAAARKCGLRTLYVERPLEESCSASDIEDYKNQNTVDIWIRVDENGFIAAAEKLGIIVE